MLEDFDENRSDGVDPLDSRILDFDYSELDEEPVPIRHIQIDAACDGLGTLARYQLGEDSDSISQKAFEAIGRRVVALWWGVNPAYFDGTPSLAAIAKRLDIDESGLSRITAELRRAFWVHNRAQSHGDGVRNE